MGWQASDIFYIGAGATTRIDFWWDAPGDRGAQWALAHPLRGEPPAGLATERVGKRVDCTIGQITINGPAHSAARGDRQTPARVM